MMLMLFHMADIAIHPAQSPFSNPLQTLVNILAGVVILLGGVGFLVGLALKAAGTHGGNMYMTDKGGSMMVWGLIGVALSGAAAVIINWALHLGQHIH